MTYCEASLYCLCIRIKVCVCTNINIYIYFFFSQGLDTSPLTPVMPVRSLTPALLQSRKRFGTSSASSQSHTYLSSVESECYSSPRWERGVEVRTVSSYHYKLKQLVLLCAVLRLSSTSSQLLQLQRSLPAGEGMLVVILVEWEFGICLVLLFFIPRQIVVLCNITGKAKAI